MFRPQILFVTCHLPYPPVSGGRRREVELIKRLARDFDIHLVAVSKTPDEDFANAPRLRSICRRVDVFPALPPASGERAGAPRQCLRHRSPELTRRVRDVLAEDRVDLVHVEGFFLMQHLPGAVPAPVLLAEQNVEHDLDLQRARSSGRDARSAALTWRAEVDAWRRATAVTVVTEQDRDLVRSAFPGATIRVVPDGADHVPLGRDRPRRPRTREQNQKARAEGEGNRCLREQRRRREVVFVANFGYEPNVDAAIHLCRDVLPPIERSRPDVEVWLVGNAPPPSVRALARERVVVTGRVEDVVPYIDAAAVVACPLRIGGGVKVKTIEALRRGKAIVSTSIGAQGLPAEAHEAIEIADDPGAFAASIARLLADAALLARMERRAAAAAESLPTWDSAAAMLADVYEELAAPALAPALQGAVG